MDSLSKEQENQPDTGNPENDEPDQGIEGDETESTHTLTPPSEAEEVITSNDDGAHVDPEEERLEAIVNPMQVKRTTTKQKPKSSLQLIHEEMKASREASMEIGKQLSTAVVGFAPLLENLNTSLGLLPSLLMAQQQQQFQHSPFFYTQSSPFAYAFNSNMPQQSENQYYETNHEQYQEI